MAPPREVAYADLSYTSAAISERGDFIRSACVAWSKELGRAGAGVVEEGPDGGDVAGARSGVRVDDRIDRSYRKNSFGRAARLFPES